MGVLVRYDEVDERGLIEWADTVELTERAFESIAEHGSAVNHPRRRLYSPSRTRISIHAGAATAQSAIGMMIHCERPALSETHQETRGPAGHHGGYVYVVFDDQNAELLAIVRRTADPGVTDYRTASTSAVGTRLMARPDARVLGLFGSGFQARCHLEATSAVLDLERVRVFSPTAENREAFAAEMDGRFPFDVRAVAGPKEAVVGADVVVEATSTAEAVFDGRWLEPGTHVTTIGGSDPQITDQQGVRRQAIDARTVDRSDRVCVTSLSQLTNDQQAPIFDAIADGRLEERDVVELGDLVTGERRGRSDDAEITVYNNNGGMGAADVAIAGHVYRVATEAGLTVPI